MPAQEMISGAPYTRVPDLEHGYGAKPVGQEPAGPDEKKVPYLRPGTTVPMRKGTTMSFESLSEDDYEELGGVEYRALTALLWIVAFVCSTFISCFTQN